MNKVKCPRCKSKNIFIDDIDGYQCKECRAWFDYDDDGSLAWGWDHRPPPLSMEDLAS